MHPSGQETFRVGFVLFVALIILVGGVILVGKETLTVGERVEYVAYFEDVGGLDRAAPVLLGGKRIGRVKEVEFSSAEELAAGRAPLKVVLEVDKTMDDDGRLRTDSVVVIETEGMLGDKQVTISPGHAETTVPIGGVLESQSLPFLTGMVAKGEKVVDDVSTVLADLRSVLKRIEEGDGTISLLLREPTLHDKVDEFLDEAKTVASEYRQLGKDLDAAVKNLETSLTDLTGDVGRRTEQTLASVETSIEQAGKSFEEAAAEIRHLAEDAREGEGTLPKLINDPALYESLEEAVARISGAAERLAGILDGLSEGEGTLGALLKDRTLITSLEDIIDGLQESSLIVNLIRGAERQGRKVRLEQQLRGGSP